MFSNLCQCLFTWIKADKNRCIKYSLIFVLILAGIILFILDLRISKNEIQGGIDRNSYGGGVKQEELSIRIEGYEKENVDVDVFEQMYTDEETDQLLQKCITEVEKEMLGANESVDYVTKDLNLMNELTNRPIEIEWKLDSYDVMNIYGEIQKDNLKEEGIPVQLEALITYTENPDKKTIYECMVMVYPEKLSDAQALIQKVKNEIQERNKNTQKERKLLLPDKVEGRKIHYYKKLDLRGLVIIIISVFAAILFYAQEIQNQGQENKKRKRQMMEDYPEIVNKLTLFLGAGMTMKRAFRKVVSDYELRKEIWGYRYAYEEMRVACREMESGITEAESYERFGRRCGCQEYIRLGALLSQNTRKGTKGLGHILRLEAIQAFENRKAAAKKFGEEAGTKLLLPMFIMFAVVLVVVIVPAFLSMQT